MGDFASLADLIVDFETVTYGGKTFKVTGLTFPHIVHLVRNHRTTLEDLYLKAVQGSLPEDVNSVVMDLADQASGLCGMIIACGMGEPAQAEKATQLPISVQIDALEKIIRLTLVAEGGVEKLMETVTGAVAGLASLTTLKA